MSESRYSRAVLEHFHTPRNMGAMENPSAVGNAGNPQCGDVIRLYVRIKQGVIVDAKAKVLGCPVAIAAASVLTEILRGKTLKEAMQISNGDISEALGGLPPEKLSCSVLAEAVVRDAIGQYGGR
ncbi:MAG: iron-sulfur cluster assembly scaffold protein [bacterium]|nr:iron-sulfur cluster assembly scaffold protein [bacterium]